ncbi:hypothetical protein FORMB_04250 [Formosa sp. Hel1_33_131]|nr:hypothetical protein FORMB_04250 [Formosa sp. Hel1_33_131]
MNWFFEESDLRSKSIVKIIKKLFLTKETLLNGADAFKVLLRILDLKL